MLLLASETALELEVRAALQNQHCDGESSIFFELVYLDPTYADFLSVLELLDHIRHGISMQCTYCLPPLRGQALHCRTKAVTLNVIFPEDLGGDPSIGPSSSWTLGEIQLLEGISDARRAAGCFCQFTGAESKRPIGVLSTSHRSRLHLGWPLFDRIHERLVQKGPLPESCACGRRHSPLIGFAKDDEFNTAKSIAFGIDFWQLCVLDNPLNSELILLVFILFSSRCGYFSTPLGFSCVWCWVITIRL